jgi:hypothetical protein
LDQTCKNNIVVSVRKRRKEAYFARGGFFETKYHRNEYTGDEKICKGKKRKRCRKIPKGKEKSAKPDKQVG